VNIYATFYFHLPLPALHLASLSQVMSYSFALLLLKEGLDPKIKWPNDVQLHGKKVSGVLTETIFHRDHVEVFLGIGINVNMDTAALAEIDQPATSLKNETGKSWDRKGLLKALQTQFSGDLQKFKKEGFKPFHDALEKRLALKGQTVRCFDGKKEWVGICHSLASDGRLNLLLPDQKMQTLLSGDITTGE
jgi:BirA family biotin operon repressor/biotin-[acetyl-CoA-carboxylase] ligase